MTFDERVDISSIKNLHEDIREAGQAQVFGFCHLDGDEIIFTLNIVGKVVLSCSRTVVDVPYNFYVKAKEIFSTSEYYGNKYEEEEIHFLDEEIIEINE